MDLLKIYENNKKNEENYKKQVQEYKFKQELNNLISAIIKSKDTYETENELLIKRLNIKAKKRTIKRNGWNFCIDVDEYEFKITKELIVEVNKYLNENGD